MPGPFVDERSPERARDKSILQITQPSGRLKNVPVPSLTVIEVTPALLDEAARLANAHLLRAYDAVQLAAALEIDRKERDAGFAPVTLISADQALNDAATVEGFSVDNPNSHPRAASASGMGHPRSHPQGRGTGPGRGTRPAAVGGPERSPIRTGRAGTAAAPAGPTGRVAVGGGTGNLAAYLLCAPLRA